jgi:hypothetical protein
MDTSSNDGSYFTIDSGKSEDWTRQSPGATVFVCKGGNTGDKVDVYYCEGDDFVVIR